MAALAVIRRSSVANTLEEIPGMLNVMPQMRENEVPAPCKRQDEGKAAGNKVNDHCPY